MRVLSSTLQMAVVVAMTPSRPRGEPAPGFCWVATNRVWHRPLARPKGLFVPSCEAVWPRVQFRPEGHARLNHAGEERSDHRVRALCSAGTPVVDSPSSHPPAEGGGHWADALSLSSALLRL